VDKTYTKQIRQFGKHIKALRKRKQWTQLDLAIGCGVDIRTIQRIEAGEYGVGLHNLFALAVAFEMQPHTLLESIKIDF
jgi:transcriptional regulator with XRE-family HTH domain